MLQTLFAGAGKIERCENVSYCCVGKKSRLSEKYSLCTGETVGVAAVSFVLVVMLNFRM